MIGKKRVVPFFVPFFVFLLRKLTAKGKALSTLSTKRGGGVC